jgi:ankyrin repeat protein
MTFGLLHRFIKKSDIISFRRELDAGMSPDLSNRFAWTLLMLAALEGETTIGELLIARGADINATNKFGETALSLAAHKGHARFMRLLLAHGASTDCRPHGASLESWLKAASPLPQERILSVLELLSTAKSRV